MEIGVEGIIEAEATEVEDFNHTIVGASIKGIFRKGTQTTVEVISPITTLIPKIPNLSQIPPLAPHAKSATNLDIQPLIAING